MNERQNMHSSELKRLLSTFPSWIKYVQVGIIIFIALIFAFLFYFV